MSTVASTTLVALAIITAATFALCFGQIDTATWEWACGISGGGAAGLHLSNLTNGTLGLSSAPSSKPGADGS
jgi:hypothetical protein